jgi:hypothetical protein
MKGKNKAGGRGGEGKGGEGRGGEGTGGLALPHPLGGLDAPAP